MTTTAITRTIKATIKGKMEKEGNRGQYLSVQVVQEGKGGAPGGGRFPETYNCWDIKQLEHVKLNESVSLILHRDGVKADKQDDGEIASYWWSISGVADSTDEDNEYPSETTGTTPPSAGPESYQDVIQYRIQLGMAFNAAITLAASQVESGQPLPNPVEIRYLRDTLLHDVILVPVRPPHWCYTHEVQRVQSQKTGVWGHVLADRTACTE